MILDNDSLDRPACPGTVLDEPEAKSTTAGPLVAVLDRFAKGYKGPNSKPNRIQYLTVTQAFLGEHKTDAHFTQYSAPEDPVRINKRALTHLEPGAAVEMLFYVVDVDGAEHAASDEWRNAERAKVLALSKKHPIAFYY